MDEIKDILLEDEEVLWTGQPFINGRRTVPKPLKKKLKHVAWMLFAAIIAVYLFYIGNFPNQSGFVQTLSGVIIVLIGIGLVIATFALLDKGTQAKPQCSQRYAITDKRVIVIDTENHWRQNIMGRSITGLHITKFGDVSDLQITHGNDDFTMMSSLPDAGLVERLLLENFAARKEQS